MRYSHSQSHVGFNTVEIVTLPKLVAETDEEDEDGGSSLAA